MLDRGMAWAVGPSYLVTAKHVVVHDSYRLDEVYISHPSRPSEERYRLSVHAISDTLDLAILVTPDVRFHRLAVDEHLEAYMPFTTSKALA